MRHSTIVLDFEEGSSKREKVRLALEAAAAAFEALRPENHETTSDAELASLISSADEAVHAALEAVRP